MASSSMKLHQFTRGLLWPDHESSSVFKRLRPLAPKTHDSTTVTPFDLKNFIRPNSGTRKFVSSEEKKEPNQVETHPGGTRWNPTQEQIGILEMLYRGGMRTPNAQQIEQITMQLSKYGKIEGKNVFYWFQNHKARERQKQKRTSLGLTNHSNPRSNSTSAVATFSSTLTLNSKGEVDQREEESPYKRSCMSRSFESTAGDVTKGYYCKNREDDRDRTLELFPLHPEGRS